MRNELRNIEKMLRAFSKRCKNLTYTKELLFFFLMTGALSYGANLKKDEGTEKEKKKIENSIEDMKKLFKESRNNNNRLLKSANLELIQLMEQGDHVVKSPWSSWQFGINMFADSWGGTYKGKGDKSEKYLYEGILTGGEWWEKNVSPLSNTYSRITSTGDIRSSLTNVRKDLGLPYGLVVSKEVPDPGVPLIIEPKININIPDIPTLNITPNVIHPNIRFTIPDVSTVTFSPTTLPDISPNVFNPPALDQVATGFSQDMNGTAFYLEPNVIMNNSSSTANTAGTTVTISDNGFTVDGAFTYTGRKDNNSTSTTANRSGKVTAANAQVTGVVDGTWLFNESNPKGDNSTITAAQGASNIVNSTAAYNSYNNATGVTYRSGAASSPQTVFSFTQYQQDDTVKPGNTTSVSNIAGDWIVKNNTSNPIQRNKNYSNTLRFISVNGTHVASFYDPMKVDFNGNLNLYGRSAFDTLTSRNYAGWTHMTVAVEQQAASAKESIFTNNGVITLEKEAAKPAVSTSDDALGSFLIGMTAMIEDYAQYQPTTGNIVNANLYSNITYRPWASEMNNKGTINVNSVESIGVDFSEFNFSSDATGIGNNTAKQAAWGNKGSLRIYMNTGDINVKSTDPGNLSTVRGSYGIRVPNIFNGGRSGKNVDAEGIYYDETIIDGNEGTVTLTGSHNVGVSISKKIGGSGTTTDTYTETQQTVPTGTYRGQTYTVGTGTMSVYNYQTGIGANGTGTGGVGTTHGIGTAKTLDNAGRTAADLIGNIYNLNIVVDGKENVGFLRNYDYMYNGRYGSYSTAALALAQGDFNIKDSHVKSINFTSTTDGGTLFRTDRFGINLEKNLTGSQEVNPGNASAADGRYNIVMLANGTLNPDDTVVPKVKNTGDITVSAGGRNVIGLMAYNGGAAEVAGNLTITDSPTSIGLVINGSNANNVSSATSSGNISVTGTGSTGVYNNGGEYSMTGGSISADGTGAIAVYSSADGTVLATTELGSGTVSATGTGAVALYAGGGSDIKLNGTTLSIGNDGLLFYGSGVSGDTSQLYLTGNATANIGTGGTAFYVKNVSGSPLESIRHLSSTGTLTLNMANNSTLIVAEGNGGNVGGELVSNLSSSAGGGTAGIVVNGATGSYVPYKASRVHLTVDQNSNLDNQLDTYLNSEFSSSSITVNNGITVSGSGAITAPAALASKAKAAIAQKNTTSGVTRSDVILTNNGTINLTGTGMAGIVGEFSEIYNNSILRTVGNDSTAIIVSNGGIATNNGDITVGNGGVGIAGINYLGVTESPSLAQPATGNGFIEIVHNGKIVSEGTSDSAIGILALDMETNNNGTAVAASQASKVTLGNGSKIDVSSSSGGVGLYSKGVYRNGASATVTDNGSDIVLNTDGVGMYSEGAAINTAAGTITSVNNATAQGIFTDSDVTTGKNITLLGDKSIGIHNYGVNAMYSTNLGRSYVNIDNSGTITLGNSADINDPSIGIYTKYGNIVHSGKIDGGSSTLGILSETGNSVNVASGGTINVGNNGIGIYKKQGTLTLNSNSSITAGNGGIGAVGDDNVSITNSSTNINVGDNAFGFAIMGTGTNNYTSTVGSKFEMGSGSVYLYKSGANGLAETYTFVNSAGNKNAAIYATNGATIDNRGDIVFASGVGNVGAYSTSSSAVNNYGNITVAGSDVDNELYSIGMGTKGGTIRNENSGKIKVTGDFGIGMFAQGVNSYAENNGIIEISGNTKNGYGMYLDDKAKGVNNGIIKIDGAATGMNAIGVAVLNGAEFTNNGTIDINLNNSVGVYIKDAVIKNYGNINISGTGSVGVKSSSGVYEDASGNQSAISASNLTGVNTSGGAVDLVVESAFDPSASKGSTSILPDGTTGTIRVYVNGEEVDVHNMSPGPQPYVQNYALSNVGVYIDTLGRTRPINWVDGYNPLVENDLIIGVEATELSTAKAVRVGSEVVSPFFNSGNAFSKLNIRSASLTWVATPTLDPVTGVPNAVTMAKVPYTDFVNKSENAWNFADGLEQRYGVEGLGSREKKLFDKLNLIGQNQQAVLTQAFDEMMGHQYSNTQQRLHNTGRQLDKEISHLKKEWETKSKESNKIKIFGMREEYSTDTAGVIDYNSNSYGFAYLHEDETIKLGNSSGWYAGGVNNIFKFKDIGTSKENTLMLKAGVFKSTSFDHNGSLKWTISGEGFVSKSDMHRKYLVVDEIFNAKSNYYGYGAALKNELGKEFRISEATSIRPYGSLKVEYGKTGPISEKEGEMRLEIAKNDYYSIKPEIGVEFKYKKPVAKRSTLLATLNVSYENELGKVGDTENKGRVKYTTADWFDIPGEKDDRKGNVKADLNVGIENQRVGVTFNAGYDTKGENTRFGVGIRAIY